MSQAEYEAREAAELHARLAEVERAPLADRKAARAEWASALTVPRLIAQRVGWLLDGCYGKGAYDRAWSIVRNPRCNRVAQLAHLIAALEWGCPADFATQAWKAGQNAESARVNEEIEREIREYEKDGEVGQ